MDDFYQILRTHARRYPAMEPQDAVKLTYQSVFGGGHMIDNRQSSEKRLKEEYAAIHAKKICAAQTAAGQIQEEKNKTPQMEPIGGGMIRFYLPEWDVAGFPPSALNAVFCSSANHTKGDMAVFAERLRLLEKAAAEGVFSFDAQTLAAYLQTYAASGMPVVHHSNRYAEAYHPAYRVLREEYLPLLPIVADIYRKLSQKTRVVIAIDGMSGSGKTTMASMLAELTEGACIHMDDFFLPFAKRTPERLAAAGGNVDYERFAEEVLPGLRTGNAFSYGVWNCSVGEITEVRCVPASQVYIVEGTYAVHTFFQKYYDVSVFLHVPPEEQMRRILLRNGEKMAEKFRHIWIPMENRYFREQRIAERCAYVLSTSR